MVIKSFKIFERGDGVEEENDFLLNTKHKSRQLEFDFEKKPDLKQKTVPDYIVGIPSGEIIWVKNVNDLKFLSDRRLAHWTHDLFGKILNCYATPDKNIDKIKEILNFLRRERPDNKKFERICQDFRSEIQIITGRQFVVAWYPYKEGAQFYIIIPDIDTNWSKYKNMMADMVQICYKMNKKYPGSKFSFGPSYSKPNVEYYGLPSEDEN
jgi:hypothetical protein